MKNLLLTLTLLMSLLNAENTFHSLKEGETAPQNFSELWKDFNPQTEPLDTEILEEWEEDGVIVKVLRYRAGIFKGQKAMVAAVYGYPKGGENLPALVNVHGGGQYADANSVISNAKRGYATISVSWAGRLSSSKYKVNPEIVKLFWEGKTEDPKYKLTTDWGAVDGYHAPCRHKSSASAKTEPHELTLDEIDSPRNSLWFLATVAARRAITFLEQQPVVNPEKIGIYGHSMGGKITVLTAATDKRLKVAVPTCGGISNYNNDRPLYNPSLGDPVNLAEITCPILFLSPANDFHGNIYDLPQATELIKSKDYRVSSAPHHNHQDSGPFLISGFKWIDHYLKGEQSLPTTPQTSLQLKTESGTPELTVIPDSSWDIKSVDIFYTQQGAPSHTTAEGTNPRFKYWHHSAGKKNGKNWIGELPLPSTEKPLWVYANVTYALPTPESATNYYYAEFTTEEMTLSSVWEGRLPEELQKAGVKASLNKSAVIEDFSEGWENGWFAYDPVKWDWAKKTNKLYSPIWKAPSEEAILSLQLKSQEANTLVLKTGDYATEIKIKGGAETETFNLKKEDFKNASGVSLENWKDIQQLEYAPFISISSRFNNNGIVKTDKLQLGTQFWKGSAPDFQRLMWVTE